MGGMCVVCSRQGKTPPVHREKKGTPCGAHRQCGWLCWEGRPPDFRRYFLTHLRLLPRLRLVVPHQELDVLPQDLVGDLSGDVQDRVVVALAPGAAEAGSDGLQAELGESALGREPVGLELAQQRALAELLQAGCGRRRARPSGSREPCEPGVGRNANDVQAQQDRLRRDGGNGSEVSAPAPVVRRRMLTVRWPVRRRDAASVSCCRRRR